MKDLNELVESINAAVTQGQRQVRDHDRRLLRVASLCEGLAQEIRALLGNEPLPRPGRKAATATTTRDGTPRQRTPRKKRRQRLTAAEKADIRRRLARNETQASIGKLYNLAPSSVGNYSQEVGKGTRRGKKHPTRVARPKNRRIAKRTAAKKALAKSPAKGKKRGEAITTADQRLEIVARMDAGERAEKLAKEFGYTNPQSIYDIRSRHRRALREQKKD